MRTLLTVLPPLAVVAVGKYCPTVTTILATWWVLAIAGYTMFCVFSFRFSSALIDPELPFGGGSEPPYPEEHPLEKEGERWSWWLPTVSLLSSIIALGIWGRYH
jgi:hypothetical protein